MVFRPWLKQKFSQRLDDITFQRRWNCCSMGESRRQSRRNLIGHAQPYILKPKEAIQQQIHVVIVPATRQLCQIGSFAHSCFISSGFAQKPKTIRPWKHTLGTINDLRDNLQSFSDSAYPDPIATPCRYLIVGENLPFYLIGYIRFWVGFLMRKRK